MLGWHKIWIDDIIMVTTWPRYNLQIRYKTRTRICISRSTCSIDFKHCQMCWVDKGITSIRSSWLLHDFCIISRTDREWGLDFVYQVIHALSNFAKKMGLKKAVQKIFKYLEILKKIHYYLFSNDFSLKTNNLFK